ncbi:hypothetical protein QM797_25455 [Rhodococcus sp. IEGM 1381]|nr:hypothetical protein [Rhodococcus sp. IEGM 1381]MDI9898083.1 hypothetical protein [Rhodococcus sp. IEGM 1381]
MTNGRERRRFGNSTMWHNLSIAEARTKAGMNYNRGLAQHWVEPVNA